MKPSALRALRRVPTVVPVLLLLALFVCPAVRAQEQPERQQDDGTAPPRPPATPARVIDVEAARRAKLREHSISLFEYPIYPFILLGRQVEKGLLLADRSHLMEKLDYYLSEHERGFLPLFGGLGEGSGLVGGVKYYRNDFLRPGGKLDIPVRFSSVLNRQFAVNVSVPLDSSRRLWFDGLTGYLVRTQDDFYGLGNDSQQATRTDYRQNVAEFFAGPRLMLTPRLQLASRFGWRDTGIDNGRRVRFPGVTQVFAPTELPGVDGARMWIASGDLVYDCRDAPGRTHSGAYYRLGAGWHQSADSRDFAFWRYYGEARQYVPLFSPHRTLALRVLVTTNIPRRGSEVPFFEQAVLGGSRTFRSYRPFRFYDRSGLLATAEYRYNLNSVMDFFAFVEEGQVARQLGDMRWGGFRPGFGAGLMFGFSQTTPFRITIGQGREGTRWFVSLNSDF